MAKNKKNPANNNYGKGKNARYYDKRTNPNKDSRTRPYDNSRDGKKDADRLKHFNSRPKFIGNGFKYDIDPEHNDPSWSKDQAGIVERCAKYGTYLANGRAWFYKNETQNFGVPTALICEYIPYPGVSTGAQSAMSIAAQQLYQHVRKSLNKTLVGYQFADPFIAYIAFTSLVIQAEEMKRDFRIAYSWSSENYAWPDGILAALGYSRASAKDLKDNLAVYRERFNYLMNAASSIFLPMETNSLYKYEWMSQNLWGDKDSVKSQVYGYMSSGYYVYSETAEDGAEALWVQFDFNAKTTQNRLFDKKLQNFEACLSYLRDSDSYNVVMSDLRTAYSGVQGYVFGWMPDNDPMQIQYNDIMLRQFQNIRTLPTPPPAYSASGTIKQQWNDAWTISQSVGDNTIKSHPERIPISPNVEVEALRGVHNILFDDDEFVVNWSSSAPSEDEVIENLDGVVLWRVGIYDTKPAISIDEGDSTNWIPIRFVGTTPATTNGSYEHFHFTSYDLASDPASTVMSTNFWQISMFDWFPFLYYGLYIKVSGSDTARFNLLVPVVEDDVLGRITTQQIQQMNIGRQFAYWRVDGNDNVG